MCMIRFRVSIDLSMDILFPNHICLRVRLTGSPVAFVRGWIIHIDVSLVSRFATLTLTLTLSGKPNPNANPTPNCGLYRYAHYAGA